MRRTRTLAAVTLATLLASGAATAACLSDHEVGVLAVTPEIVNTF